MAMQEELFWRRGELYIELPTTMALVEEFLDSQRLLGD
jgi:hypothetical protein